MPDAVHRLRLGAIPAADAVVWRHRAEALWAGGMPRPRALPPGALLCVQRVSCRLPSIGLAQLARQGALALERALEQAWSQAVRPSHQSPGMAVSALWFADEAELLVFLARRALAGDTRAWWWAALTQATGAYGPGGTAGAGEAPWAQVATAWRRHAGAVPAALAALGAADSLAVLVAVGEAGCGAIAVAVADRFHVPGGAGVVAQALWATAPVDPKPFDRADAASPAAARGSSAAHAGQTSAEPGAFDRPRPRGGCGEGTPSWALSLRALAGALHQAPWAVNTADFAARLRAAADDADGKPADALGRLGDASPRWAPARAGATAVPQEGPARAVVGVPTLARAAKGEAPAPVAPLPRAPSRTRPSTDREDVVTIASPHAGLFFVVPLLLAQGLYADFAAADRPGLALHPAALLRAIWQRCARRGPVDELPDLLQAWCGRAARNRSGPRPQAVLASRWGPLQAAAAARLGRRPRGALAWLVRRPGLVHLGATRLDVHFDLATHALAIRSAGLDRDPGWMPAAGRHIAFHFALDGAIA